MSSVSMTAYYESLSKMKKYFNPMNSASKVVVRKEASTRERNKCQLLLQFNAGHLRRHGVFACVDL